jgi:hypothetical protein
MTEIGTQFQVGLIGEGIWLREEEHAGPALILLRIPSVPLLSVPHIRVGAEIHQSGKYCMRQNT